MLSGSDKSIIKVYKNKDSSSYTSTVKKGLILSTEAKTINMNNVYLDKHSVFGSLQVMSVRRAESGALKRTFNI